MLTIGSFAVALFSQFLAVVRDVVNRGADVASADRMLVINRTSIINLMPLSPRQNPAHPRRKLSPQQLVRGTYIDEKEFFPQFVIDLSRSAKCIPSWLFRRTVGQLSERPAGRHCRR